MRAPGLALAACVLAACSPRLLAVRTTGSVLEHGAPALFSEPDPAVARASMPGQIQLLEVFLANDPGNPRLRALAAQACAGYAFLFLEEEEPERARAMYRRGRDHGWRWLKARGWDPARPQDPGALERFLAGLKRRDAEGLFWAAQAWGGWANLSRDEPAALAGLPTVEKLMERVEQISPGHWHGGPDVFLGAYYGGRPRLLGGDPVRSKRHFERAAETSGGRFLTALYLQARYLAVQTQDREMFRSLLAKAAGTDASVLPEARLPNAVARERARRLLAREDELFE